MKLGSYVEYRFRRDEFHTLLHPGSSVYHPSQKKNPGFCTKVLESLYTGILDTLPLSYNMFPVHESPSARTIIFRSETYKQTSFKSQYKIRDDH